MPKKLPVPLPPGDEYYAGEPWRYSRPWARIWIGAGLISASLLTACVGAAPRLPNDNDTTDNVSQPANKPTAPAQSSGGGTPPDPGPGNPPSNPGDSNPIGGPAPDDPGLPINGPIGPIDLP